MKAKNRTRENISIAFNNRDKFKRYFIHLINAESLSSSQPSIVSILD